MSACTWVFIRSEAHGLWTVGFYDPAGEWQPESDFDNPGQAAERARYLNGGTAPAMPPEVLLTLRRIQIESIPEDEAKAGDLARALLQIHRISSEALKNQ